MKLTYLTAATILFVSSLAFAQGSGSTGGSVAPKGSIASTDDFKVTRSLEGKIAEIKSDEKLVVIENKKGERYNLKFTDETKIASLKTGDGGAALKWADLKAGQNVKAVFRPSDSHAVALKVLR